MFNIVKKSDLEYLINEFRKVNSENKTLNQDIKTIKNIVEVLKKDLTTTKYKLKIVEFLVENPYAYNIGNSFFICDSMYVITERNVLLNGNYYISYKCLNIKTGEFTNYTQNQLSSFTHNTIKL